ncbi:MAG: ATP-binding cassette domain-containing protein [Chloroflexi bacterium]|nr:ATP-binding cassette domain-containing protein [Chloroflexota bacterium]
MNSIIHVEHLRKTFDGVVAVDDLSFDVFGGEIFGLLGPNGAGKTTTIRVVMDILKPDAGSVRVLGEMPGATRERVGYLPEERGLYRDLRVAECLIYLGELKGMPRDAARRRAQELLARVELAPRAESKIQDLSRGMQQKLQIIASLLHDPELVILDEPFQGLDPVNVEMVRQLIRDLRAAGKTIVLCAHEMSQVEALCERILLIDRGKGVLYGTLAEIKKQFAPHALEIAPPLPLAGWREVARAELRGDKQIVYLAPQVTPREFLQKILVQGLMPERFEAATMSLEEIFIAVVKGA